MLRLLLELGNRNPESKLLTMFTLQNRVGIGIGIVKPTTIWE